MKHIRPHFVKNNKYKCEKRNLQLAEIAIEGTNRKRRILAKHVLVFSSKLRLITVSSSSSVTQKIQVWLWVGMILSLVERIRTPILHRIAATTVCFIIGFGNQAVVQWQYFTCMLWKGLQRSNAINGLVIWINSFTEANPEHEESAKTAAKYTLFWMITEQGLWKN